MNMLKRELDQVLRSCSRSRPSQLRLAPVLLCGILLGAAPVLGQPVGRNLTGTVTDRHHEPLAGAIVQVHSETTLSVVSYITDRAGQYVFKHLSPDDDYDVFATYRGVRSKARRLSKFDSKADRQVRLVIKLP
jgi:hypothetical protein